MSVERYQNIHATPTSAVCHYHCISAGNISSNCAWVSVLENMLFMEKGMLLTCKPLSTSKNQAGWVDATHLSVSTSVLACWVPGLHLPIGPPSPQIVSSARSLPLFPSAHLPRADWQAHRIRSTLLCQTGTSFLTHLCFLSFSHSCTSSFLLRLFLDSIHFQHCFCPYYERLIGFFYFWSCEKHFNTPPPPPVSPQLG